MKGSLAALTQNGPPHRQEQRDPKLRAKKPANGGPSSQVSITSRIARLDGGRDRDRTCDPYHVKVVLFR
jgi:hypothetical protein